MTSRLLRWLLATMVAAALTLGLSRVAHAQAALTIYQEQSLIRLDKNNNQINKRALQYTPEGVSYQDCIDDQRIGFTLQMAGFVGNATVEVWAALSGADCGQQQNRTSTTARVCWPLVGGVPLTTTQTVNIPVRDIMSGALSATAPDTSQAICGQVDLTTIGVEFLYFDPGNKATASVNKTVSVQVDTVGPAPPSGVSIKPGNERLTVEWANISGEGGVSVLTGVKVYCDPAGTTSIPAECADLVDSGVIPTAAAKDAGVTCTDVYNTDEAGADAGVTTVCTDAGASTTTTATSAAACNSSNLVSTTSTSIKPSAAYDKCFACGSITGNSGTTVVAESIRGAALENNKTYAVAVAATDAFNNVGPLSSVLCEYPEETNDFWQAYRNAGGNAGGGCATSGDAPLGSLGALGGVIALVGSMLRRQRDEKRNEKRNEKNERNTK